MMPPTLGIPTTRPGPDMFDVMVALLDQIPTHHSQRNYFWEIGSRVFGIIHESVKKYPNIGNTPPGYTKTLMGLRFNKGGIIPEDTLRLMSNRGIVAEYKLPPD